MLYRKGILLIAFVAGLFCFIQLSASENVEVHTIKDVSKKITALGEKYGVDNVIVTFDIDCTLLTQADNFGSDIWWNWQSDLFSNNQDSPYLVSKDFAPLLKTQRMVQSFTKCYPTEADYPEIIKSLQKKGFAVIALTARGPEGRDLTEEQLKDCGYDFSKNRLGEGFPGTYLPYNVNEPEKYGLTAEDINNFNLKPPRAVSFWNGIMMTSGQNKGIMLKTLLNKVGKKYKAVVLVDDGKKNTDNMYGVYKASQIDVNAYRYTYDDAIKRQFEQSNKHNVIEQWNEYKAALKDIFGI